MHGSTIKIIFRIFYKTTKVFLGPTEPHIKWVTEIFLLGVKWPKAELRN
jgi:hypothetical protein